MKKILAGLAVWSVSSVVLALPVTHGTYSINLTGSYPDSEYVTDGGLGSTASSISSTNSGDSAQASASLLSSGGVPELKVYANAGSDYSYAHSSGMQRYQYTGADTTLSVVGNFHGIVDNSTSVFRGRVGLWHVFEAESLFSAQFGRGSMDQYIEESPLGRSFSFGHDVAYRAAGEFNLSATANINLETGDEFYLYGSLMASAEGGVIDALSTGTFAFDFAGAGITSADLTTVGNVAAVPVPAALYLFIPALLGLFGFKRKAA